MLAAEVIESAATEPPKAMVIPAIVMVEWDSLLLSMAPASIALVTFPVPIVVPIFHPACELAEPVMSPVRDITCAAANFVAVAALPLIDAEEVINPLSFVN